LQIVNFSFCWQADNKYFVPFVPKQDNPPIFFLTHARPIEDFWAHLSRKVYDGEWQAENEA
jgi:hypothetical protein